MKKISFFMDGNYYLVPDDFNSYEQFFNYVKSKLLKKKKISLTLNKLNEIKCLAPYFVDSAITCENVTIFNINNLFKCEVEVLTMKEYNDKLRNIVKDYCKGCINFGSVDETDESLEGHHEEISLDKVCVFRKTKEDNKYYLFYAINRFINNFLIKQKTIENLIDKGDFENASKAISFYLGDILGEEPVKIIVKKTKRKYFCFIPSFFDELCANIYKYICIVLNKQIKNWEFVSYLPKGTIKNYNLPKPKIRFVIEDNGKLNYISIKCENGNSINTYLAICNEFGENDFLTAYNGCIIKIEENDVGKEFSYDFVHRDIKRILNFIKMETSVPVVEKVFKYDINNEIERSAIFTSNIFFISSENLNEVFSKDNLKNYHTNLLKAYGISVGKLRLNTNVTTLDKEVITSLEKIVKNECAINYATEICNNETIIHLFIYSIENYLALLRYYSPMLTNFGATIEICEEKTITEYKINYLLEKLK